MNTIRSPIGCEVCGGVTYPQRTFCTTCERRIMAAIKALDDGDSVVVAVPAAVN